MRLSKKKILKRYDDAMKRGDFDGMNKAFALYIQWLADEDAKYPIKRFRDYYRGSTS